MNLRQCFALFFLILVLGCSSPSNQSTQNPEDMPSEHWELMILELEEIVSPNPIPEQIPEYPDSKLAHYQEADIYYNDEIVGESFYNTYVTLDSVEEVYLFYEAYFEAEGLSMDAYEYENELYGGTDYRLDIRNYAINYAGEWAPDYMNDPIAFIEIELKYDEYGTKIYATHIIIDHWIDYE
ncbi:MAG: hypothetical protein PHT91_02715 [Candidatus Nanoarchaeia archaeon]|nr:hypothetical protein [Candidatus Nanoarchaeia archaeon]